MCASSAPRRPWSGSAGNQLSDGLNDGDGKYPGLARSAENKHEMQLGRGPSYVPGQSAVHFHRFRPALASLILNAGYNHDNIRNVIRSCDDLMRQELSHLQTAPV